MFNSMSSTFFFNALIFVIQATFLKAFGFNF